MTNIKRLNPAEIQNMGKTELRAACKARGISYASLTVGGMRDAVLEWEENRVLANAPADAVLKVPAQKEAAYTATPAEKLDTLPGTLGERINKLLGVTPLDAQVQASLEASPPVKAKKVAAKPQRVSVMAVLRGMEVGKPLPIDVIVKTTGVKQASLMTTALSCNSKAPSNARLYETGLRFKRDGDSLVRTA